MRAKEKIDLFKLNKDEYAAPKKPTIVNVKKAIYLTITGMGAPGGEEFSDRAGALYAIAYTIKMTRKFDGEQDYVICKLEGEYWGEDGNPDLSEFPQEEWCWRLMVRTPEFVGVNDLKKASEALLRKGKQAEVEEVKLEPITQGTCVQMLHVGPYDREEETIAVMEDFAAAQGLKRHGRHREIYLSDPRRVPPERLKTILRLPVRKK